MPFTGSFSALPSWIAAFDESTPRAVLMSSSTFVDWLKMSLPLPASFLMFRNVNSMFSPDWTTSSSMPVLRLRAVARFEISLAVTFAAPPVDFRTACVCRATLFDSWNALTARFASRTSRRR
jgi:hypothetical protein